MSRLVLAPALAVALGCAACDRVEPRAHAEPPPAARSTPTPAPPAAPAADSDSAAAPGTWTDAALYRFRVDAIKGCGPVTPPPAPKPARPPAYYKDRAWVGVSVRVGSKTKALFVSPRDLTLERGGIILRAAYTDAPALPACAPALPQKDFRPGREARGFALFEVPPSFRAAPGPITLAYHPTRWGGARRTEVRLPDCLDCPR